MFNSLPIKCLNPIKLSGQGIYIPCGKCCVCQNIKSLENVSRIQNEALEHFSVLFVTLTYHPIHVPTCKVYINSDDSTIDLVDDCLRSSSYMESFHYTVNDYDLSNINLISRKHFSDLVKYDLDCDQSVPRIQYLLSDDVVKFQKRLRRKLDYLSSKFFYSYVDTSTPKPFQESKYSPVAKHVNQKTFAKIRLCMCGEYGPKTFRPHYHYLFFCKTRNQEDTLKKILRACWKYGRVDIKRARDAARYVAGYINSYRGLPSFLSTSTFKPFFRRSNSLGEKRLPDYPKEITKYSVREFIGKGCNCTSGSSDFRPWISYINRGFPKIRGYSSLSDNDVLELYRSSFKLEKVTSVLGSWRLTADYFSLIICDRQFRFSLNNYFKFKFPPNERHDHVVYADSLFRLLIDYDFQFKFLHEEQLLEHQRLSDCLYGIFLTSKKFDRLSKLHFPSYSSYDRHLKEFTRIKDFYSFYNNEKLFDFYDQQSQHKFETLEELYVELSLQYFNWDSNWKERFLTSRFYNPIKNLHEKIANDHNKFKKLNDINDRLKVHYKIKK